ncbi:MAG: DMT family transporter [Pseudomonadota bacterium]
MQQQSRAYAYGLGAVLCWSTVATAFKLSLQYLSPAQLLLLASFASWLLLGAHLIISGKLSTLSRCRHEDYRRAFLRGILNPFLYYLVLFRAYDLLPAQEAQAINYTWALTTAFLAVPILGQRLSAGEILAALVSYAGVVVIATRGAPFALEFANPLGVGLALASTLLWALYWVYSARDTEDPGVSLFLNFTMALPLLLLYCLWQGELQAIPWQGAVGAVYVGVFEMGLSFLLWLKAMRLTDSTIRISSLIFLAPPLSLVLIYFVLGEQILPSTLVGLGLILGGLALQQRSTR